MNFAAINASIAWHEAAAKREVSPVIRKLRERDERRALGLTSGIRTYVKGGITLPSLTILERSKTSEAKA